MFTSIFIYLTLFLVSYLFFSISENSVGTNKKNSIIAATIAIFILAFAAGIRDVSVGTDTSGYTLRAFNINVNYHGMSFLDIYKNVYSGVESTEWLYVFIQFFISRFTNNYFWSLFFVSFSTILFFFLAVRRFGSIYKISVPNAMLIFCFLFYNESLNLMRQVFAASVALYAASCFLSDKKRRSIFFYAVAISLHKISVILCIIPIIYYWIDFLRRRKIKAKWIYMTTVCGAVFILLSLYPIILFLVTKFGLNEHYLGYVESGSIGIYTKGLLVRLPILAIILFRYRRYIQNTRIGECFFIVFLIELVMINAIYLSPWAYRLYGYFQYPRVFLMAAEQSDNSLSRKHTWLRVNKYNFLMVSFSFIWWLYYTVYLGVNDTIPYMISLKL